MTSFGLFFSLSSLLIHLGLSTATPTFKYHFCLGGNYTSKSPFQANLNLLLSSLSSNTSFNHGFYNFTTGEGQDRAYGLFLCRGDVTPNICQNCVKTACEEIVQRCPYKKVAITWYEECMLRYSNRSIFSTSEESPQLFEWETSNVSNPNGFNQILGDLMYILVKRAAFDSSTGMFATGEANFTSFQKIYGLVQCTPDLSPSDCDRCLRGAIAEIPSCCNGRSTGSVFRPSCYFKYSVSPFYQPKVSVPSSSLPVPPPPLTGTRTTDGKGRNSFQTIVIVVVPTVITVILLAIMYFYVRRRKPKEKVNLSVCEVMDDIASMESLQFAFGTIRAATKNFSDTNKVGVGGFGVVYKGKLSDGQEIAVKRLSRNSGQGQVEFKNEVALLSKLQHRNLVRLLGFCLEGEEKQLIYEFVPNRSLDYFLFDPIKRADLDWKSRYKIIEGIARGLLYLHEDSRLRIIHRDLKPSNILLDADMIPKISDFGMAKLFVMDQTQDNTNKIVGTFGYMPPEYAIKGLFSVRSDAFSFGVILLEIISGKRISSFNVTEDSQTLLEHAWRLWNEGKGLEFVDPLLKASCPATEVMKCLLIGLLCVQEDVTYRPTMSSVLVMLRKRLNALPPPRQPAFSIGRSIVESDISSVSGKISSGNDITLSSISPR